MMNRKSFTLMEVITVIIIIGLVAAFALPNFGKAVAKAAERNGIVNLRAIHGARQLYFSQTGSFPPFMGGLPVINGELGLALVDTTLTYQCLAGGGECTAQHSSGWRLHFHTGQNRIHCREGNPACPSCQTFAGGGCINGEI